MIFSFLKRNKSLLYAGAFCLGLSSCGKTDSSGSSTLSSFSLDDSPIKLVGNSALTDEMRETLANDLHVLGEFSAESENEDEIRALMGVADSSGGSMLQWLQERVRYISGPVTDNTIDGSASFYSQRQDTSHYETQDADVSTIAANLGSALYMTAKKNGIRSRYNFSTTQTLDVLSPRVGLIILYEPYFNHKKFGIDRSKKHAYSNTLNRISTLLHEARHSDGNGSSLGFPHVECPDTKPEYAGYAACDVAVNGAYAIEAAMQKKFIEECIDRNCSHSELAILRAYRADYLYRLLDEEGYEPVTWDPDPEAVN